MRRPLICIVLAWPWPALPLSADAREFISTVKELEPVHCEKRKQKRLAELEPRLSKRADAEDLQAISRQQREAFYRCE